MKNLGLLSLLLIFVFSACRKDVNEVTVDPKTPDPTIENYEPQVEIVTADLTLFVVDENEIPVTDAKVSLNGQTYTTDDFGHLIIKDETLNSLGSLVKVNKSGYFNGSRRFFPLEGKNSRIKIQLLLKTFDQSFIAADGGEIYMDNVAGVSFSPNSIKAANGDLYEGTVKVASHWLNPSTLACLDQMPGNLQGVNTELEDVALGTYGMIAIELEDEAGQALNIAEGHTAKISMPVPASLLNGAPAQIPLWSYNETYGLWVEEGMATLVGNNYVGDVNHFSFWNCDIPFDYVNLEMTLVDEQAIPIVNTLVTLSTSGSTSAPTTSGSGYTDQDGIVSGAIPANEILTMEVFDLCGVVIYTNDIGPFDVDTNLGDVVIPSSANTINNTTVTGELLDCNDDPITNGMLIASFDGKTSYHYLTSSNFSMTFSTCSSTTDVEIVAVNLDNLKKSNPVIVPANSQTDLVTIKACDIQVVNHITVVHDGKTVIFEDTGINAFASGTYVFGSMNNDSEIGFQFEGLTTGDYSSASYIEVIRVASLGWGFTPNSVNIDNLTVTEYDTRLVGSFEATVFNPTGNLPLSCTFNFEL